MTQITGRQPAPEGTSYLPGCFDSQIGKSVPFKVGDVTLECRITNVQIIEDGAAVSLTMELPDHLPDAVRQSIDAFSVNTAGPAA